MKLRGLYAITPQASDLERKLRLALEGGIALLQYRSKSRDRAQAAGIVRMARDYGVPVIVNDDVDLALELDAAGAHLGRDDGDLRSARRRLAGRILGASCYNELERARAAVQAGADYIAFGAVFASPTKPELGSKGLAVLEDLAPRAAVPVYAIGGITSRNAASAIQAGATGVAVSSAVLDGVAIAEAVRELDHVVKEALARGRNG